MSWAPGNSAKLPQRCIVLELTENCNNACKHCYNFWKSNGHALPRAGSGPISREDIRFLLDKVKKDTAVETVALSGGEPLLHPDFPGILGDILDVGLQPVVITNGVLLTDAMLRRLPSDIHFEVTLLGHYAALHNRLAGNDVFDVVIHNMAGIERYGSHLTLAFVATKFNALDIRHTVELGLALGAIAIMYNRVNLSRRMQPYAREYVPPAPMLRESLDILQNTVHKYELQAACSIPIPPCVVDISRYPDIQFGFCPRGDENAYYTIGPDGLLRPCNHSSVVLGDLRRRGFAEIVSGDKCKSFWETVPPECRSCTHPLKEKCRGGCTAAAHEFYGSQSKIDPFCEFTLSR
jgi:radical SAM protein with 4Fe4S-binding SPASM domain